MKLLIIKLDFNLENTHLMQLCEIIHRDYNKYVYFSDTTVIAMIGTQQELKTVIGCTNEWDINFTLQDWNS